jgi:hypothetical protein
MHPEKFNPDKIAFAPEFVSLLDTMALLAEMFFFL